MCFLTKYFFLKCKWRIGHNLHVSVYERERERERERIPYSVMSKDERNFITINKKYIYHKLSNTKFHIQEINYCTTRRIRGKKHNQTIH